MSKTENEIHILWVSIASAFSFTFGSFFCVDGPWARIVHNVSNMCILFIVIYCWCSSRVHGLHVGLSPRCTYTRSSPTDVSAFPSTIWCCGMCTDCLTEYRRIQTNRNKLSKAKRMNTKISDGSHWTKENDHFRRLATGPYVTDTVYTFPYRTHTTYGHESTLFANPHPLFQYRAIWFTLWDTFTHNLKI